MIILTAKKKLLAEIDELHKALDFQANEVYKLRKANTDINRLWQDAKTKAKRFGEEREALKEELRAKGMEYAATLGQKNQDMELLNTQIREQQATIAQLKDSNSGLASSVSEMKGKFRKADAKIKELKDTIAALRQKQNYKAKPKGPSNPLNL